MSVKMKFGSKDIPFVYKGDKLVYPNPIKDGLLLWYDFRGMRNTDTNKEIAKDLSGNGNDGTLINFNFTEGSGYKDNTLVFDGVDDSLTIPELELDETAMTVMYDGTIYSYEDDKVMSVGEDGEIVGSGKNLLPSFYDDAWFKRQSDFVVSPYHLRSAKGVRQPIVATIVLDVKPNIDYTIFMNTDLGRTRISGDSGSIMGYQSGDFSRVFNTGTNESVEVELGVFSGNVGEEINFSNALLCQGRLTQLSFTPAPKDYKTTTLTPASLADLQLYSKTLRKEELLHNAESKGLKKLKPGVVVQDGLVLHYDFSHESNNSAYKDKAFDYSGNGNHGELQNFNFTEESGYESKGLKFDGVDDGVSAGNGEQFDLTESLTLESTFLISPQSENLDILAKGATLGGRQNYSLSILSTGTLYFEVNNDGVRQSSYKALRDFYGQIVNIQGVADSSGLQLYLNGELVHENNIPINHIQPTTSNVEISNRDVRRLRGYIYSTKIYNRPLTPEEIAHNYQIEKEKFNIVEGEM